MRLDLIRVVSGHKRTRIILVQLVVIMLAYTGSWVARFNFEHSFVPQVPWTTWAQGIPVLIVARMGALWYFNLYRGLWRYVSVSDLVQITKATIVSSAVFTVFVLLWFDSGPFPESVLVLDFAANLLGLGAVRVAARLYWERSRAAQAAAGAGDQRLLVIGAGEAGVSICREALRNNRWSYKPVALVDDDKLKTGDAVFDVPIVGTTDDLASVVMEMEVDIAILAIPSALPDRRRVIVEKCLAVGLQVQVLPDAAPVLGNESALGRVRRVEPADLMVRPPAVLNHALINGAIKGRRVLVTGAAGSVGSELVRQIAAAGPELIVGVDRAENPLLLLAKNIRADDATVPLVTLVADVSDDVQLPPILKEYKPSMVFHAAAFKHVGFMEDSPGNAVRNNVGGTLNVARSAMAHSVEQFVLVSTDKAVRPTSVMGATKRIAELMVRDLDDQGPTKFTIVRFGNVLGSNASVVPIFNEQIERGGPLTVTDRGVTRFFMSIPEAAGLILQATAMSDGGDIFQLDMGDPVRILDLAETMITLSGFKPYEEIDIVFTGLLPGEKMHEELTEPEETFAGTDHPKLFVSPAMAPSSDFMGGVAQLLADLNALELPDLVKDRIQQLLPEYSPA